MRNWQLKLFALVSAIILSLYVTGESNTSIADITLPVQIKVNESSQVLISPLDPKVRITVRGPASLVARLVDSPRPVKLEIPDDLEPIHVIKFEHTTLGLPSYIKIERIEPRSVIVETDSLARKEVPIKLSTLGTFSSGISFKSISLTPQTTIVTGPRREVDLLNEVETYPLDVRTLGSGQLSRELELKNSSLLVSITPRKTLITAQVEVEMAKKTFNDLTVEIRTTGEEKYVLTPRKVTIEVNGPKPAMESLSSEAVLPFVRPIAEEDQAAVQLNLPTPFEVISITPPYIKVTINSNEIQNKKSRK